MNSSNPTSPPAILLTDNPKIAELFNDLKYSDAVGQGRPSLAKVIGVVRDTYPESSLFLSNENTGFIELEIECTADGSPRTELTLYETSEFFELKLLRSATANILAKKNGLGLNDSIVGPTKTFYIAFGLGDNLDYWAPFSSYYLIAAESLGNFNQARVINLSFAAGFGLGDFSTDTLKKFINPEFLQASHLSIFDQFRLTSDTDTDSAPNRLEDNDNPYIKARREYRKNNTAFYIASLDNLIEKTLQVVYNTDNVLVLNYKTPFSLVENFIKEQNNGGSIVLEDEYQKLRKLVEIPPAGSDSLVRLRGFYKVLEEISKFFNINVSTEKIGGRPLTAIQSEVDKTDAELMIENIKTIGYGLNSDKQSGIQTDKINSILSNFISGYNSLLGVNTYCYTREADLSVLKIVDEAIKKRFKKSFFDKSKPLIIFGPKELVSNYFYGQSFTITKDSDFAETPPEVAKITDRKLSTVYNLYNGQNTNNTSLQELIGSNERAKNLLNSFVKSANYPVFKYNMQNSNVMELSISDNRAYFLLLDQAYNVLGNYASIKTTSLKDPTALFTQSNEEAIINEAAEKLLASRERLGRIAAEGFRFGPAGAASGPPPAPTLEFQQGTIELLSKETKLLREKIADRKLEAFTYKLSKASDIERLSILVAEDRNSPIVDAIITAVFCGRPQPNTEEIDKIKNILYDSSLSDEKKLEFLRSNQGINEEYLSQEALIYADFLKNKYGLITDVEDSYARDPLKFFVDQLETFDKVMFQIEIETLPFFPISNYAFIYTPCLLFAQRPSFLGDTKTRNPLDSISGAYNILGYKHRITQSSASSSFRLFGLPRKF